MSQLMLKQIYIKPELQTELAYLAKERGISETELIARAIEDFLVDERAKKLQAKAQTLSAELTALAPQYTPPPRHYTLEELANGQPLPKFDENYTRAWLAEVDALRTQIDKRRGGKPQPDSVPIIRALREERLDEYLAELLPNDLR